MQAQLFKHVRVQKEMNLTQFAAHLGISRSMLGKIERGSRKPSEKVYKKLLIYVEGNAVDVVRTMIHKLAFSVNGNKPN